MKILLRSDLLWHEATYEPAEDAFYAVGDPSRYFTHSVLAVKGLPRHTFIRCDCCGKTFQNTRKAIEAHKASITSIKACLSCPYTSMNQLSTFRIHQRNGGFVYEKKVNITCGFGGDIRNDDRLQWCKYRLCTDEKSYKPVVNFFYNHPHVFDRLPTVGCLNQEWKPIDVCILDADCAYRYNGPFTIDAVIRQGLITSFIYRRATFDTAQFIYSLTEQTLFCVDYDNHTYTADTGAYTDIAEFIAHTLRGGRNNG